jgi:hypothetical protein
MSMAHGHSNGHSHAPMNMTNSNETVALVPSYFADGGHAGMMLAHGGLMMLAWVFVLPIGM